MTTRMMTVSVSMPKHLVNQADEIAGTMQLTRSKLITHCLEEVIEREKRALLIEGYKAMAKEHNEFARLSSNAAKEVLPSW